ncbi:hypothetical protein ACWDX6_06135 [Streptomyces sp. NPDC003027]
MTPGSPTENQPAPPFPPVLTTRHADAGTCADSPVWRAALEVSA